MVELAIVLVIIGLIIGGVLVGQTLINAAELRAQISQIESYRAATHTFRLKYRAMPGDMANATAFWGALDADNTACKLLPADGTATCNGNGNKIVLGGSDNERFRFWQHLGNANLIGGQYTGVTGSGGTDHHIAGENCPDAKISGAGVSINYIAPNTVMGTASIWPYFPSGNYLKVGRQSTASDLDFSAFGVREALSVDQKLDDGLPAKGKVWSAGWQNCTTAASRNDAATATYNISYENDRKLCVLLFYF